MTIRDMDGEAGLETFRVGEQGSANDDPEGLRIYLLGGFRVSVGSRVIDDAEWRLRKAKTLVKLLALAPGHRMQREQAMDILWRDLDPEAAGNNLRKTLHVGPRALEPSASDASRYLRAKDELLALRSPGSLWIDNDAFEAAASEANRTRDRQPRKGDTMAKIGQPYTSGRWLVRAGSEEDFIERWTAFTEWSLNNAPGAESFVLIQDTGDPRRFLSFGAWDNPEAVAEWRQSPKFGELLGECRALCEEFEPHDYELAATPGG